MYIALVCFGIITISVLCTMIEIKTEVELICIAVCLGLSLEDLVLERPIFKSAHSKKITGRFFPEVGAPGGKKVTRSLLHKAKQFAYHLFALRMGRTNLIFQGVKEGLFFDIACVEHVLCTCNGRTC